MSIKKTDTGSYAVNVFYPKEIRKFLGTNQQAFRKRFSTFTQAKIAEEKVLRKIHQVQQEHSSRAFELKAKITLKEFYDDIWLDMYTAGSSGSIRQIPLPQTIKNTKNIFRLHILPMFGKFTLKELNDNPNFVLHTLNNKAKQYVNIKAIKSYINQIFDSAELLEYIEQNRISKSLHYVTPYKKNILKEKQRITEKSLTASELITWIEAVKNELSNHTISFQDYVLFILTLNLGNRKSESYALQWKHIDLKKGTLQLIQSKDKHGHITSTKGKKHSILILPTPLIKLLKQWKTTQKQLLKTVNIKQTPEQFLFTYTNRKGKINTPVHIDYLNYRLKTIEKHNPHLPHLTPHKLRHTFSTLAYEGGASLENISHALTHSNIKTTQNYINTPTIIDTTTYQNFQNRLQQEKMS